MVGHVYTNSGRKVLLNRGYKLVPDYLPPTKFQVAMDTATPLISDTAFTYPIPITNGTVIDTGATNFTGSSGGDNSTDNTSTYKIGAGTTDTEAQNLIANGTNATKIWTLAITSYPVTTKPFSLWFYVKDAATLAKFKTSGTCLTIKLGSDASNYYAKTFTAADLSTGWNYLSTWSVLLGALTQTGTVTGNIDTFIIEVITNNAADTFAAGDVVYDILRQWAESDLIKSFDTGYPSLDENTNIATIKGTLYTTEANGFIVGGVGSKNEDATPILFDKNIFTPDSKSDTDEFIFTLKHRLQ